MTLKLMLLIMRIFGIGFSVIRVGFSLSAVNDSHGFRDSQFFGSGDHLFSESFSHRSESLIMGE
jgi:hypothetical protein